MVSAVIKTTRRERAETQRRKDDFLIFLRTWKFEMARMRDLPATGIGLIDVVREWRGVTLASWFFEKLRLLHYHKNAIEADLPVRTSLALGDLVQTISGFRPSQLQETQHGALPGRDRLSQAISALISFVQSI